MFYFPLNFPSTSFHPLTCQHRAASASLSDCYFDFSYLVCFLCSTDLLGIIPKTEALENIIKIVIIVIMAQNQIIYVFLLSAQLGWVETVDPCSSTVKFSLVQFSFLLSLVLISIMRPVSIHLARGCYRQDPETLPCQEWRNKNAFWQMQAVSRPTSDMSIHIPVYGNTESVLSGIEMATNRGRTQKAQFFCQKDLSHKPCWDNSRLLMCGKGSGEWWLLPTNTRESNENQPGKHHCRMRRKCK